jgi:hypothetical protein
MEPDPRFSKALDFTRTESLCMQVWLEAVQVGELAHAQKILNTGLLAEHYRSLLPDLLSDAGRGELATLSALNADFAGAVQEFRARHPRVAPPQDDRGLPI